MARRFFSWKYTPLVFVAGIFVGLAKDSHILTESAPLPATCARVCFSPWGKCEEQVLAAIKQAETEIKVLSYAFTSRNIANALIERKKAGIDVQIIADKEQLRYKKSAYPLLRRNGLNIKPAKNIKGIQHNKCMIIDQKLVITGSYNFTYAANTRNTENLLIINNLELVKQYLNAWNKIND